MGEEILNQMVEENDVFQNVIDMLHEFDYKKNGKLTTIHFLSFCIHTLSDELLSEIEK